MYVCMYVFMYVCCSCCLTLLNLSPENRKVLYSCTFKVMSIFHLLSGSLAIKHHKLYR